MKAAPHTHNAHPLKTVDSLILSPRRWPIFAVLISAGLLGGAYAFQYIGGLAPCQMCYWQRHAHKAVLAAAVLTLIARQFNASRVLMRVLLLLIVICFVISAGLAFWHVGVEYKWWEGPKTCLVTAPPSGGFDPSSILQALEQPIAAPACSDVAWSLLGLSMAGWNALISFIAALLGLRAAVKG